MRLSTVFAAGTSLCLFGCGGGGGGSSTPATTPPPPPATYTVGGQVSGLAGSGLILLDNGSFNLAVAANRTSFSFATAVADGSQYNVTIMTQPFGPSQTCTVVTRPLEIVMVNGELA
jgi:hypothetical protein